MGDMLSQAEIDALLSGYSFNGTSAMGNTSDVLTPQEKDALGEIGNICMGTSATTLYTLLGQKVLITTPKVTVTTWDELSAIYPLPFVAVKVEYTKGLVGSNLLIINEQDVKIITDLMMGGDGSIIEGDISDLHLSAISEAMNQMVGSSSTSMSSMFDKRIDISPPKAFIMHFRNGETHLDLDFSQKIVNIAFKMKVGNLIDSEIMQILPVSFAKELVNNLLSNDNNRNDYSIPDKNDNQLFPDNPEIKQPVTPIQYREPVNVQPVHFQSFEEDKIVLEKKNISLIMDVPLQVTVELGRTQKIIKEILEFGPGSIIELDKLAGEPVDIFVNGKPIAKGEVVVIDESFGVRITDIIHPSKRL